MDIHDLSAQVTGQREEQGHKAFMNRWIEPPLRTPVSGSHEQNGHERQANLGHLQPLGLLQDGSANGRPLLTQPRVRQMKSEGYEVDSAQGTRESLSTIDPIDPEILEATSSAPYFFPYTSRDEEADLSSLPQSARPRSLSAKGLTPLNHPPASASPTPRIPIFQSPGGRRKLDNIVEQTVRQAKAVGNPVLGLAVRQIYIESFENEDLAYTLDAILTQPPTEEQKRQFQAAVKKARKHIKAVNIASNNSRQAVAEIIGHGGAKVSPESPLRQSQSSTTLSISQPQLRPTNSPFVQPDAPALAESKSTSPGIPVTFNGDSFRVNGTDSKTPSEQRQISRASSTSSLSSVDEDLVQSGPPPTRSDRAKRTAGGQPISALATQPNHAPGHHTLGNLSGRPKVILKRSAATASLTPDPREEEELSFTRKRLRKSHVFNDYQVQDSYIRSPPSPKLPTEDILLAGRKSLSQKFTDSLGVRHELSTGLPGRIATDSLAPTSSRQGTPLGSRRKKAARVKISPVKKKIGVVAGIAPGSGEMTTPVASNNEESDNDDYCSACTGGGYLICCDGCDRSFHFTCLDPPLDKEAHMDEWYCTICQARRSAPSRPPRGLLSLPLSLLEKHNPKAFQLPVEIRDYFESVETGSQGEYQEAVPQKAKNRVGYENLEVAPDLLKLKDAKGNPVLCYACGKSALSKQEIIQCDYCSLQWHLDCLDPPLSNPPRRVNAGFGSKAAWMCPNHVDHELIAVKSAKSGYSRIHRIRRPKKAKVVDTQLRRGFVNNGIIEVDLEPSEDEGFYEDHSSCGVVYRLPERGVKLDFIEKVKRIQEQDIYQRGARAAALVAIEQARLIRTKQELFKRSFLEQKTALNLAQFAQENLDLGLGVDEVENLVGILIAEAPAEVVTKMIEEEAKVNKEESGDAMAIDVPPTPPSSEMITHNERKSLMAIQELIRRKLEGVLKLE